MVKLPDSVTIRSNDLPPGARGLAGTTFRVRYSKPLRFRLWLAVQCMRLGVWLTGVADTDIGPKEPA